MTFEGEKRICAFWRSVKPSLVAVSYLPFAAEKAMGRSDKSDRIASICRGCRSEPQLTLVEERGGEESRLTWSPASITIMSQGKSDVGHHRTHRFYL
jgi:hypothetical protein